MVKIDIVEKICEKVASQIRKRPRLWETVFDIIKKLFNVRIRSDLRVWKFVIRKREPGEAVTADGGDIEITPRRILTFKPSAVLKSVSIVLGINNAFHPNTPQEFRNKWQFVVLSLLPPPSRLKYFC